MPLMKCPDCGKDVSTLAPNCPQCGRPLAAVVRNAVQTQRKGDKYEAVGAGLLILGLGLLLVNPAVATDHQNPNPTTDNQLQVGSPAIGFADPNYALPFDITGKCRGASPDAGAYER